VIHARRAVALQRERNAAEHIPYTAHVGERVVRTGSGDYLQAFRLGGASFESADDEQLNNWHERLNVLWRNLASPDLALWTHVIRRRERAAPRLAIHTSGFAQALAARYATRLAGETLMVNELYLAVLFRPAAGLAAGLVSSVLSRARRSDRPMELNQALETCAKLAQIVQASLARYDPEPLGAYLCGNTWCSALLEYLAVLVNGERRRVPLPRGPLNQALATTRLLFGTEAIEYRMPAATRVGAMLGIKEYPTPSLVGMFNRLLSAPFALVLTHSFTFLTKASGQALLQRQFHRMANAGDFSRELSERYKVAVDLAIHLPRPDGDPRNFHAHLLTTTREVKPTGLGAKTGLDMNNGERGRHGLPHPREEIGTLRERWANLTNEALREANVKARVEHRSLAERGIDREPRPHFPIASLKMEQRGVRSEVAERIREGYRRRVAARLERSAQVAPAPELAARSNGGDGGTQPKDLEEIRRQAREAWRQLRAREADGRSDQGQTGRELEEENREPDTAVAARDDDDLAL